VDDGGRAVLLLLATALVAGCAGWVRRVAWVAWVAAALAVAGLVLAAALAAASGRVHVDGRAPLTLLVVLAGALAVIGGGPVTSRVFVLVDGRDRGRHAGSMRRAGEVLRGGAWIGALERAGIFASLVAGWPEGLAIVLGLKGLGRYPELRSGERTGAAERFIIGTFTSVLWAAACAGVVRLLV
jgi:hypothetical protein